MYQDIKEKIIQYREFCAVQAIFTNFQGFSYTQINYFNLLLFISLIFHIKDDWSLIKGWLRLSREELTKLLVFFEEEFGLGTVPNKF